MILPSIVTPEIVHLQDATIEPASGVAADFSSPFVYTVTAKDISGDYFIDNIDLFIEKTTNDKE